MTGAALSHVFANDYGDYGFHIFLPLVYRAWHRFLGARPKTADSDGHIGIQIMNLLEVKSCLKSLF